jgi:hypothetical protein
MVKAVDEYEAQQKTEKTEKTKGRFGTSNAVLQ